MKKTLLKHGLLMGILAVTVLAIVPFTVNAETMDATTDQMTHESAEGKREAAQKEAEAKREAAKAKLEETKAKAEAHRTEAKARLSDAKLRVCEKRQDVIANTMKRVSSRAQKQVDLFSGIAERTQNFYDKKGKTLAGYDGLVADVGAKKAAAEEAIAMITTQGTDFKCTGDNPKGTVTGFKEHHSHVIVALKEYKTAVKNLIVGVKSVQGTMSSEGERK